MVHVSAFRGSAVPSQLHTIAYSCKGTPLQMTAVRLDGIFDIYTRFSEGGKIRKLCLCTGEGHIQRPGLLGYNWNSPRDEVTDIYFFLS
jgi:hypothetical protein